MRIRCADDGVKEKYLRKQIQVKLMVARIYEEFLNIACGRAAVCRVLLSGHHSKGLTEVFLVQTHDCSVFDFHTVIALNNESGLVLK